MKIFIRISIFLLAIVGISGICSARTVTYCGYNKYKNYYCVYSDGCYSYRNKQGNGGKYDGLPYFTTCTDQKTISTTSVSKTKDSIKNESASLDKKCQNKYGIYSLHEGAGGNYCKCKDGYLINKSGTKCEEKTKVCKSKFGSHSYGAEGYTCKCEKGYKFNGNECVKNSRYKSSDGGIRYINNLLKL